MIALTVVATAWLLWPRPLYPTPSTKTFAGHRLTLRRLQRLPNNEVMATLLVYRYSNQRLSKIGRTDVSNARLVNKIWAKTEANGTVHVQLVLRPNNPRVRTLSITQGLDYTPLPRKTTLRFANVSPAALPATSTHAGLSAVLRRVHVNRRVDSNVSAMKGGSYRWIRKMGDKPGRRMFYGAELDLPLIDGASNYWECMLYDNKGVKFMCLGQYWDRFILGSEMRRVMGRWQDANPLETMVYHINRNAGERLYNKRWERASRRMKREVCLFIFPEMQKPPKRITLLLSTSVPQPGGSTVTARFDNMRLP